MDHADIVAVIEEATHHRGWISNSYAQVEFLLGYLILRCREYSQYKAQTSTFTHSAPKRVAKVRAMLRIDGPLTPHTLDLTEVVDAFDANHPVRNLLAHGFCEFNFTAAGDAGLLFRKFERGDVERGEKADILVQRTFRLIDIRSHRERFEAQAQRALEVFAIVHFDLGWGEIDPTLLDENGWQSL